MFCRKNTKHLICHGHVIGYEKKLILTYVIIYLYHMTFFLFATETKGFQAPGKTDDIHRQSNLWGFTSNWRNLCPVW